MSEKRAFPWEEAMHLGLGVLRWSPDTFWRATPRELIIAWEGLSGGHKQVPLLHHDMQRMMAAFPDDLSGEASDR
ncbi:rcc01693 family protein [Microvirga flavescens]|uniref:rcc01693 family protein n=1 Tax=Microvirga flavescens TaxID=2249811 RepID=UPI000DDA6E00|nr:rcc01693 family protein [Microvirga flavescens]